MAPEELTGFSVVVVAFMFLCAIIGAVTYFMVGKSSVKFFVGGRNLNLFVMTATIASQSLDANAALGNIDLGYNYHWWDGACLPLLRRRPPPRRHLLREADQRDEDPILPDLFARTFGPATEVLFSFLAILSFLMLLGGNLVGVGKMLDSLWPAQRVGGNRDLCVRDLALHRRGRPPLCRVHRLRSGHHRLGGPRRRHHLDPQQHAVCGRRLCGLPTR